MRPIEVFMCSVVSLGSYTWMGCASHCLQAQRIKFIHIVAIPGSVLYTYLQIRGLFAGDERWLYEDMGAGTAGLCCQNRIWDDCSIVECRSGGWAMVKASAGSPSISNEVAIQLQGGALAWWLSNNMIAKLGSPVCFGYGTGSHWGPQTVIHLDCWLQS